MAKIKIYTTKTCQYCHAAKEFFKEEGISFTEIDVTEDKKAQEEMVEKSGQMGVPVIDIDGEIIIGFNREKIEELIKK